MPTPAGSDTILWPDPLNGPWRLTLTWTLFAERIDCTGFHLEADPPQPVTTYLMRQVPWSAVIKAKREERVRMLAVIAEHGSEGVAARARKQQPAMGSPRHPGGRPQERGQDHYEQVARVVRRADAQGVSFIEALGAEFGSNYSESLLRRWITEARKRGLLEGVGRAGRRHGTNPQEGTA